MASHVFYSSPQDSLSRFQSGNGNPHLYKRKRPLSFLSAMIPR